MMAMVVVFTWAQGFPYLLESTKVLRRNRTFFPFIFWLTISNKKRFKIWLFKIFLRHMNPLKRLK